MQLSDLKGHGRSSQGLLTFKNRSLVPSRTYVHPCGVPQRTTLIMRSSPRDSRERMQELKETTKKVSSTRMANLTKLYEVLKEVFHSESDGHAKLKQEVWDFLKKEVSHSHPNNTEPPNTDATNEKNVPPPEHEVI
jgi:hypothetical protein